MSEQKEKTDKEKVMIELRELDEEIKALNSQLDNIDTQLSEINSNKDILLKFADLKKGDELRVPLASGIYIKATLKDIDKLMVNVGAGVTVDKTPVEVIEILESQLEEMNAYKKSIISRMKIIIARIEEIQKEFE